MSRRAPPLEKQAIRSLCFYGERFLGRKCQDAIVQADIKRLPFTVLYGAGEKQHPVEQAFLFPGV